MTTKAKNSGGKRANSGRKPIPIAQKKIRISTSLARDVVEILRNSKLPIAQTIERAVRQYFIERK